MPGESDEILLTAYALGELDADDRTAVEARLAQNPDAQRYVEEVRATAEAVTVDLAREPAASLDAIQYAAIEMRLRERSPAVHPVDRRAVLRGRIGLGLSIAASVLIVLAAITFVLSTLYRHRESALNSVPASTVPKTILIPYQQLNPGDDEPPRGVAGAHGGSAPFENVADHPVSSFALNTDTSSYEDLRQALFNGRLPARRTLRIEGLINAFDYDPPPLVGPAAFGGVVEIGACPWRPDHALARIAIKARDGIGPVAVEAHTEVAFNPESAKSYRLIGYESDADGAPPGETIAAGHSVTALYEVVPADPADLSKSLLTLRVRYRDPGSTVEQVIQFVGTLNGHTVSNDFKFAGAVAELGMLLRDFPERGTATAASALALAQSARGPDPQGRRQQFIDLARRAKDLLGESPPI